MSYHARTLTTHEAGSWRFDVVEDAEGAHVLGAFFRGFAAQAGSADEARALCDEFAARAVLEV